MIQHCSLWLSKNRSDMQLAKLKTYVRSGSARGKVLQLVWLLSVEFQSSDRETLSYKRVGMT